MWTQGDNSPLLWEQLASRAPVFVAGNALEAVSFVAGGYLAFAKADECDAFGGAQARTMPPVSTNCAAGDVLRIFVGNNFIDVRMPLQHGKHV